MSEEEAQKIVDEFREKGGAFVEDDFRVLPDGSEVFNPEVHTVEAESWLLDKLMGV